MNIRQFNVTLVHWLIQTQRENVKKKTRELSCPVLILLLSVCGIGLTVDSKVHGAPVLAGDEGVLSGVAPVRLGDGEAVQLPDGHVVEALLHRELDLHAVPQPATLHVVLVHLELEGRSVFLQNLKIIGNITNVPVSSSCLSKYVLIVIVSLFINASF